MNNYRIYFEKQERDDVVRVLRKYNDIIIDTIYDDSVGITIERDNSELLYQDVLAELDRTVYNLRYETGV